jgi:hypothetical protein
MIKVIAKEDLYLNLGCVNQIKIFRKNNEYIYWGIDSIYNQHQVSSNGAGVRNFNNEDFNKYFYIK